MQHNENITESAGQIGDFYVNPNRVQLCWLSDELITVCACYPGVIEDDDVELEFSFIGYIHTSFTKHFNIDLRNNKKAVLQINKITGEQLQEMYNNGLADVACTIDIGGSNDTLYFRKEGNVMKAYDDDNDQDHEVPSVLETTNEFTSYTRWYFTKNKH